MRRSAILTAACLLAAFGACVPSLHPLYTEKDLIADPALLGIWTGEDEKERWRFTQDGPTAYKLVYIDKESRDSEFSIHILKLGGATFLDFYPGDVKIPQNDFFKAHLLRAHLFLRVTLTSDSLQMSLMKPDWLLNTLKEKPGLIKHEIVEDRVILTAPTGDLQKFIIDNLKTKDVFTEPVKLKRLSKDDIKPGKPVSIAPPAGF